MGAKVKICGITNPDDAKAAEAAGADFVGLIFEPKSPRYVDITQAAEIVGALRGTAKPVGVFVSAGADFVRRAAAELGLFAVQLHGGQSADFAREVKSDGVEIWRVVWADVAQAAQIAGESDYPADALLADAKTKAAVGGTGNLCDWRAAAELAKIKKLVLAGGISPENVRRAVEAVKPWAVDANSAVEINPRKKDLKKIEILIENVK